MIGYLSVISRTKLKASSKFPLTAITLAPCIRACANFPRAIAPFGISTIHLIPDLAAYAAADAEVFPVEAHIIAFEPSSIALETAMVIPRSLKEPVGFKPSYFRYTSEPPPIILLKLADFISGVLPSKILTIGVLSVTGKNSLYFSIIPL